MKTKNPTKLVFYRVLQRKLLLQEAGTYFLSGKINGVLVRLYVLKYYSNAIQTSSTLTN
jgi:hypothetical protein